MAVKNMGFGVSMEGDQDFLGEAKHNMGLGMEQARKPDDEDETPAKLPEAMRPRCKYCLYVGEHPFQFFTTLGQLSCPNCGHDPRHQRGVWATIKRWVS